jgi:hypothetical protein
MTLSALSAQLKAAHAIQIVVDVLQFEIKRRRSSYKVVSNWL